MNDKVKAAMTAKSRKFSRDILFHLQKRYQGLSNTPPPCQVCSHHFQIFCCCCCCHFSMMNLCSRGGVNFIIEGIFFGSENR